MTAILIVGGLAALLLGGDLLVRGAVALARRLGVSPLLIGLTVVGFGTSTPELVTSVQAALAGSPGIALGNVVGSNIANILLILGLAAVIAPLRADPAAFRRDGTVLALATLAGLASVLAGEIGRPVGAALIAGLCVYLVVGYLGEKRVSGPSTGPRADDAGAAGAAPVGAGAGLGLFVLGLGLTVLGARLLVDGAIALARGAGLSETMIGVTIVAVGTSLPELVTSVAAARRRQGDIAFGNIIGSNIFNILGIVGATALIRPLDVPREILVLDVWAMLGATVTLLVMTGTGWCVSRREGVFLLAGYAAYLGAVMALHPGP